MGFLKAMLDGFMNPEKAFEDIENVMRETYELICNKYPDESDETKLKMTLQTRYKRWTNKEIELFLNDRRLGYSSSISELSKKVIQNEKRQLIGWNRKGITIEGEFILKKNILYNIENQNMTLEQAIKSSEDGFNDLCHMHNPLQVKNLMHMMPHVLNSVQWYK